MPVTSINKITDQALDRYDVVDQLLIPSQSFLRNFNTSTDYIEAHIYTQNDVLLSSDYNVTSYTLPQSEGNSTNQIIFDPGTYLTSQKYNVGDFKVDYRIYRKQIFTLSSPTFFISEISTDRTEIRLSSNIVSNDTIETNTLNFIHQMQSSVYYKDFLLNFGENKVVNAVNIALDKNTVPFSLLIKLYQPLPTEFSVKAPLWIVEELASPIIFEVVLTPNFTAPVTPMLAGANFDIDVNVHHSLASPYVNQSNIYSTGTLEQYQNILNQLSNDSINVNVDYTDYSDFVHFSSAAQRLVNFQYKLTQIENYGLDIATLNTIPNQDTTVSGSAQGMQSSINALIQNMDGYESYLYNVSSSYAWPKSGSVLYSVTSSQALSWLGDNQTTGQLYSASLYDLENQDNLVYTIPSYLADDPNNSDYLLFVNMLGQHYDSIWVYIKAINDIHKADNNLNKGISKDMVYTALRSLGIKLYNNNSNQDLATYLVGNASSSYTVTGSGIPISGEDQTKELYKRIYHNLPYLLKSKGTIRGLQNLISIYGIPDTILSPLEYGGSDKSSSTPEYIYDRFSYSLTNTNRACFQAVWGPATQNYIKYGVSTQVPDAVELRIKADKNHLANNASLIQVYNIKTSKIKWGVTLNYTSSLGIPSANFNLVMSGSLGFTSSSVCIPFYTTGSDGDTSFYNVLVTKTNKNTSFGAPNTYTLYVQNNISGKVGHQGSASLYSTSTAWDEYGGNISSSYLIAGSPASGLSNSTFSSSFIGQIQELRYWSEPLLKSTLDVHTLNNESIQGNTSSGSYQDLAARFPLGNNLITYNHHLTQAVSSSHPAYNVPYANDLVNSFNGVNFYVYPDQNNYQPNYELVYASSPNAGYYTPVTDKIRIVDNTPSSSVLNPYLKVSTDGIYRTNDSHYTEVSFSPQNNLNKDIIAQYGSNLDLDQYIGNPLYEGLDIYPEVEDLNSQYHNKFLRRFDYKDFVKLVAQLDNTLFKMLSDFTPARTNLSTGITIKSTILERNKVPRHQPTITYNPYTASVGNNTIKASTSFSKFNQEERFITGDISGSFVDIHDNFEVRNYNPYLTYTQSLDKNLFNHSAFNVTYGDVYSNRKSEMYSKLDPNNSFISQSVALQDSEYNHSRWNIPRYLGSKVSVSKLNVYTPGDIGYGTEPNINKRVGKLGYILQGGANSLNFFDKTTLSLKYLVNPSGSITTLTKANKNLFEVQNTFKSGTPVIISISDVIIPSNQRSLSGTKNIWKGGFSYDPILYRENNESLKFTFDQPISSSVENLGVSAYSNDWYYYGPDSGYTRPPVNISTADTSPSTTNTGYSFYVGNYKSNPVGSPKVGTQMAYSSWQPGDWKYKGPSWPIFMNDKVPTYSSGNPNAYPTGLKGSPYDGQSPIVYGFNLVDFNIITFNDENAGVYSPNNTSDTNNSYYTVPRQGTYNVKGQIPFTLLINDNVDGGGAVKVVGILEKYTSTPGAPVDLTDEAGWSANLSSISSPYSRLSNVIAPVRNGWQANTNADSTGYSVDNTIWFDTGEKFVSFNAVCSLDTTVKADPGDILRFQFYIIDLTQEFSNLPNCRLQLLINGKYTLDGNTEKGDYYLPVSPANVVDLDNSQKAFLSVTDSTTTKTLYYNTSVYNQTPALFKASQNQLTFSPSATYLFTSASIFTPTAPTKNNYTPVVDYMSIQSGDTIRIGAFDSPASRYYNVENVTTITPAPLSFTGSLSTSTGRGNTLFRYSTTSDPANTFLIGGTYNYSYTNIASTVITGSMTVDKTTFNSSTNFGYVYFKDLSNPSTTPYNYIFTFTTPNQVVATLDRNIIDSHDVLSSNFAILRPKPDETSVIINYMKQPGDISATLLVPNNANEDILAAQGTIFTTLNPSLR